VINQSTVESLVVELLVVESSAESPAARGSSAGTVRTRRSSSARSSETSVDSSMVRPGASPNQNGMVGGAPWASLTTTSPCRTCSMRHDVLPSRKMSPRKLSTAKSSSTEPMTVCSGTATTR
jgi:hypothetical protein